MFACCGLFTVGKLFNKGILLNWIEVLPPLLQHIKRETFRSWIRTKLNLREDISVYKDIWLIFWNSVRRFSSFRISSTTERIALLERMLLVQRIEIVYRYVKCYCEPLLRHIKSLHCMVTKNSHFTKVGGTEMKKLPLTF